MDDHTRQRKNDKAENAQAPRRTQRAAWPAKDATPERPKPAPAFKKRKKITASYLQNAGVYYLERFPAGIGQFRTVMTRKIDRSMKDHPDQDRAACLEMLEEVISKFVGMGLLNDALYARAMASSLRRRGLSTTAITQKLRQKGLPPSEIATALSQIDERLTDLRPATAGQSDPDIEAMGGADYIAALTLARKKRIGPFAKTPPAEASDRDKQMARLARQGFSYDIVQRVMRTDADDAADILYRSAL